MSVFGAARRWRCAKRGVCISACNFTQCWSADSAPSRSISARRAGQLCVSRPPAKTPAGCEPFNPVRRWHRKPSLEVAPSGLATFLWPTEKKCTAARYLFTVLNSCLRLHPVCFRLSQRHGQPPQQLLSSCFFLWPWTLTYDLDLRTWPRYCQEEPNVYRSNVISFRSDCPNMKTPTHPGPSAWPGPLKWSVSK